MATLHRLPSHLLLACFIWCAAYSQPAVGQIGPEPRVIGAQIHRPVPSSPAESEASLRAKVAAIYTAEIGTIEIGKNNYGPGPKKYLASCGLEQGFAYCVCFVKWVFTQAGVPTKGGTAWSPSWFPADKVIWKNGTGQTPQQGDVFGLYYAKLGRIGHGAFVDRWGDPRGDDWVYTVEGNTNGEGSREGDGVYRKRRLKKGIHVVARWIPS